MLGKSFNICCHIIDLKIKKSRTFQDIKIFGALCWGFDSQGCRKGFQTFLGAFFRQIFGGLLSVFSWEMYYILVLIFFSPTLLIFFSLKFLSALNINIKICIRFCIINILIFEFRHKTIKFCI